MAIKSYDPDANPKTKPPAISFSEIVAEFPDTGAHSLSEFYRNAGKVPGKSSEFLDSTWVRGSPSVFTEEYVTFAANSIFITYESDLKTITGQMFIVWGGLVVYAVDNYSEENFTEIFKPNVPYASTDGAFVNGKNPANQYRFADAGGEILWSLNLDPVDKTRVTKIYAVEKRIDPSVITTAFASVGVGALNLTVPAVVGSNISFSDFYSTYFEESQSAIVTDFWTNRAKYFRNGFSSSTYPGDEVYRNNPNDRYVTSKTSNWTFTNSSSTTLSPNSTAFVWAQGSSASINDFSVNGVSYTTTAIVDSLEMSLKRRVLSMPVRDISSASVTWSRSGGNSGSWSGFFVLPSEWIVRNIVYNPPANNGTFYQRTLKPYEMCLVMSGTGGDGNYDYAPANVPKMIRGSFWWYNNVVYQLLVNDTSSAITPTWDSSQGFVLFNRVFLDIYKV